MAALSCTIWEMRHALLEYQVVLFLAVFVPCFLLLKRFVRGASSVLPQLSTVCGTTSVAAFLVLGLLNLSRPGFLWHDEPSILSIAAAYVHGGPLYHDRAATELYSLLYGPCTFLMWVPILKVFAHPMPAIRVFGLALNIANLALLYLILRLRLSRPLALAFLPVAIAYLLFPVNHLFGVRGDPALLLCFTLALVCVERLRWLPAALASGVCCGLALDFKLTVAPVVCLLIALLFRRYGWKATLLSAAIAIATAASLFLLPGVSARNYLEWLALSGRQGLLRDLFFGNVFAVAFLLAPGFLLRASALPRQIRDSGPAVQVLFLAALCSCILTGSKDGAGPWHLWPMLPFLVLWITIMAARCGVGGPRDEAAISRA